MTAITTSPADDVSAARMATQSACNAVLDKFMTALNAHDAEAMDRCMHFPHPRFAGTKVAIYTDAGSNPMDLFERLKAQDNWTHSRWETRDVVQFNESKAHVLLSYTRYRADDSVIGLYESMYIMTFIDGRWGIQARSSFGP
jgi:hypothetical protein